MLELDEHAHGRSTGDDDDDDDERADLAQTLFQYAAGRGGGGNAKEVATLYCEPLCGGADDSGGAKRKDEL